jgi:hypothetical protein
VFENIIKIKKISFENIIIKLGEFENRIKIKIILILFSNTPNLIRRFRTNR